MNNIEKAMEKKNGEVTASTVLEQCIRMSNEKLLADFNFNANIKTIVVSVYNGKCMMPFYNEMYFEDMESKSLAEIMSDLISIEYEYTAKQEALSNE